MAHQSSAWCVVRECNTNIVEKRHFFRFPKEHERWLQWIRACERLDLEAMGAEYGHRNYRLCHLHFEEKWYKISKSRAHLQLDAVPTIFFGRNNACITTSVNEKMDEELPKEENLYILQQEETNSDLQSKSFPPITEQMPKCDKDVHIIAKPFLIHPSDDEQYLQ
ncbi:52 kDa repressor of the inhibitor of the protein kinase-like [Temnothorax americanus]|uniref:52 kDa repressor of the inhibitor of the protein kinase-like n=1 Tax=Temnothorax americanus TaxID=1964332 RepID=UPI0040677D54